MAPILEDAFLKALTALLHSEQQPSTKTLVDFVPFLLKKPLEICQCRGAVRVFTTRVSGETKRAHCD